MKKHKARPGTRTVVEKKTVRISPQQVKIAKAVANAERVIAGSSPKKLRVISSAMGGNIAISEFLKPICDKLGLEFVRMSEWVKNGQPQHEILWRRETWLKELSESDIVVCVARVEEQPAKSANRVVQAMALGKPVIASPLPAYLEVIVPGTTGMIARDPDEWEAALTKLRDVPAFREAMGQAAKNSVDAYSMPKIGAQWKDLLGRLAFENCQPPKVDIIIPTYNNLEYLKVCVESIRKNTDWPHNIIIVGSGNEDGTFDWVKKQPDIIHALSHERMHFSKANNEGLKVGKEKYVCLLNDDTIVGRGWLGALMHEAMKPKVGAVGPFSNCDRNWLHDEDIVVAGRHLVPAMKLEDLRDVVGEISIYTHPKVVVRRKWVAFYCTLIPREAIDRIGPLDEGFMSGDEDLDYCKRLVDAGYDIRQTYDSWVFHFGGKTRKKAEDKNHDLHHEEDRRNHAYFIKKWGSLPGGQEFKNVSTGPGVSSAPAALGQAAAPTPASGAPPTDLQISKTRAPAQDTRPLFGIYTGQAWEPWTPESLEEGGIGGSETATIYTARAFAKKGYRAVVFGDCEGREGVYEGVEYVHHSAFDQFIRQNTFQFFVSSRRADVFAHPIQAERKACVVHDIWLSPDPDANLWVDRVDKFFVLSPWHREFFLNHHRRADRTKTVVSRDGVDLERFKTPRPRERGRMVYSSSPDRGLDVLLECLPRIRKEVPETSVHVFYGFSNWEKFLRQRSAQGNARPGELEWMEAIKTKLDDPGVVYRGRIGQTQLAREIQKAEIWAQPTYFTETFCITAAENMAAGNPIVTTNLAGLNSTVGPAGVLLDGDPRSKDYQDRFVGEVVRMLTDRARWEEYSRRSLEKAQLYSWDGIADEWLALVGLTAPK